MGLHYYFLILSTYAPVLVSTFTQSPSFKNKGTITSVPESILAGFNVFVYENIPATAASSFAGAATLGGVTTQIQYGQKQYGQFNYGVYYTNKIANHIDENLDMNFSLGGSYKSSFFIGGDALNGWVADIPLARKKEFRELILKIKQVQSIGFLFINYIP